MRTQRLFGLDFVSEATVHEVADSLLDGGIGPDAGWRFVVTPNVDHLVRYAHFAAEQAVAARAVLVLPDGMPIVWASKVLGRPLARRLAGSDLFGVVWQRLRDERRAVLVLAASDELAARLRVDNPSSVVVVAPLFAADDESQLARTADELAALVESTRPDVVVIGLGAWSSHALATVLAQRDVTQRPGPVVLLVGASAEFYVGMQRRAPVWMRRTGLEWFYRLVHEPRRLARRYLIEDVAFVGLVWRQWRSLRSAGRRW